MQQGLSTKVGESDNDSQSRSASGWLFKAIAAIVLLFVAILSTALVWAGKLMYYVTIWLLLVAVLIGALLVIA